MVVVQEWGTAEPVGEAVAWRAVAKAMVSLALGSEGTAWEALAAQEANIIKLYGLVGTKY